MRLAYVIKPACFLTARTRRPRHLFKRSAWSSYSHTSNARTSMSSDASSFPHTLPPNVDIADESVKGSCLTFAPTHARLVHRNALNDSKLSTSIKWNARNHRKQRYRVVSPKGNSRDAHGIARRSFRVFQFEYWNVSWWVGFMFTVGSVVWVVNGFIVWMPFVTSLPQGPDAAGWTAFSGATIFVLGSILLVIEAWNRDEAVLFGAALKHSFMELTKDLENGFHHNHNGNRNGGTISSTFDRQQEKPPSTPKDWIWFTLNPKFFREIGFVAGFIQFWAATIFWISGFASIEQLNSALMKDTGRLDGVFWVPQVVGGTGFIVSSLLYMLEAQKKWYIPRPLNLGWNSGFWNLVGGIGFTASGAFGFSKAHWAQYQSTLCTFWGSWAFLIGSIIQWYESVNLTHQMHHVAGHHDQEKTIASTGNSAQDGDADAHM